jgi:hypothetical protein
MLPAASVRLEGYFTLGTMVALFTLTDTNAELSALGPRQSSLR